MPGVRPVAVMVEDDRWVEVMFTDGRMVRAARIGDTEAWDVRAYDAGPAVEVWTHSSVGRAVHNGRLVGDYRLARLPADLDDLPAGADRYRQVKAWQDRRRARAVEYVTAAFPAVRPDPATGVATVAGRPRPASGLSRP